jgi:hypothetical protein
VDAARSSSYESPAAIGEGARHAYARSKDVWVGCRSCCFLKPRARPGRLARSRWSRRCSGPRGFPKCAARRSASIHSAPAARHAWTGAGGCRIASERGRCVDGSRSTRCGGRPRSFSNQPSAGASIGRHARRKAHGACSGGREANRAGGFGLSLRTVTATFPLRALQRARDVTKPARPRSNFKLPLAIRYA